jgi:hypothetical protein
MSFDMYQASAPMFVNSLTNMRNWLDKAAETGDEAVLIGARLAEDMRPLSAQYQMASDSAKNGIARLLGVDPPAMADTETSFAELRDRCDRTIAFVDGADRAALSASADRGVSLNFPGGFGYDFTGADYLTRFALPNFFFHVTTAYAILRHAGVPLGKPDFLAHLGPPTARPDPA